MTSYLQRLFDRAAGLAGGPAATLSPSFSSRSPVAEADQRLNVPDLAASLFALSPAFDAPFASDDDALAGIEDAPAMPAQRRGAPPSRTAETPVRAPLTEPPLAPRAEHPPLSREPPRAPQQQRAASSTPADLTPTQAPNTAADVGTAPMPSPAPASDAPQNVPLPRREQTRLPPEAGSIAPPAPWEPIPPLPRALPVQPVEFAPAREPPQPRQAELSATRLQPRPMPAVAKTEEPVTRLLEPVPLPAPEPLPAPAPPPRDVAEVRQPTVTHREIVAAPALEPVTQPPSRAMPATAESVSRIGKLVPRRRAQLVFGLRRR